MTNKAIKPKDVNEATTDKAFLQVLGNVIKQTKWLNELGNDKLFQEMRDTVIHSGQAMISDICACKITHDGTAGTNVHIADGHSKQDREFKFQGQDGSVIVVTERNFDDENKNTIDVIKGHEYLFSRRDFRTNAEFSVSFLELLS